MNFSQAWNSGNSSFSWTRFIKMVGPFIAKPIAKTEKSSS